MTEREPESPHTRPPDQAASPTTSSAQGQSARSGSGQASADAERYWRRNLRYLSLLLSVWFFVSYGCGILLVEPLNRIRLFGSGFKLGFWFAQQGSIYVFVVLIFVYVRLMNRLDREFDVAED